MNIYFSGIGGVGIGPLAEIARDAGYSISGSDAEKSLMTDYLIAKGIKVHVGEQNGAYLKDQNEQTPIDWFVYTSATPQDNPELLLAKKLGIKTAKRDELISYIINDKNLKLIAVAGTHGKTTTTGMLIWTFKQLGIPVSYSIGTTISFGPSGRYDPNSEYFVYECDEFDRNFLRFEPYLSLITSVDYDHPDTYPTVEEYKSAFLEFVEKSKSSVLWEVDADYINSNHNTSWVLSDDEKMDLKIAGDHNRCNGTLVVKTIEKLGLDPNKKANQYLESFPGTDRRFEKLSDNLYSDYGHHPVEIAATLQMAREISDNVVLVYQPHQNIRQHEIKDEYTNQFELAESIYWLPTYLSREDPNLQVLTPEALIGNITNRESIKIAKLDDDLWSAVQDAILDDKLVLCMGAGSIDGWLRSKLVS